MCFVLSVVTHKASRIVRNKVYLVYQSLPYLWQLQLLVELLVAVSTTGRVVTRKYNWSLTPTTELIVNKRSLTAALSLHRYV